MVHNRIGFSIAPDFNPGKSTGQQKTKAFGFGHPVSASGTKMPGYFNGTSCPYCLFIKIQQVALHALQVHFALHLARCLLIVC